MRTFLRVGRWIGGGVLLLVAITAGFVYLLLQSQPGHDFILRTALQQVPRFVEGQVDVGGLRSDGLLRGFTLENVSVRDVDGRPLLEADSLRIRYSARDFLQREIVLIPADVWGFELTIETLHGDERSNVERIFMPDEEREEPDEPRAWSVALRQMGLHDGTFVLRLPVDDPDDVGAQGGLESIPGREGVYRVIRLADLNGRVSEADLVGPDRSGEHVTVDRLSFTGFVLDDPFQVEDFRGTLVRDGARLEASIDRLWFPGSEIHGDLVLEWSDPEEGLVLDAALEAEVLDLADFRWVEPRIPDGTGRLSLLVTGPVSAPVLRVSDADLEIGENRIRGEVGVDLAGTLSFMDTNVEFLPLDLALLDPWLEEPLPLTGRVRGNLTAEGSLAALHLTGALDFEDPGQAIPASAVRLNGTVHADAGPAFSDFSVTVDPLRYGTLRAFAPDLEVTGEGTLEAEFSGSLGSGLDLVADFRHEISGEHHSRVMVQGTIQQTSEDIHLALDATLDSLSLDGVGLGLDRPVPIAGWVTGSLRAAGPLGDLSVSGNLSNANGSVEMTAQFDARDPAAGYRAEGSVEDLQLHMFLPDLPEPTEIAGDFVVEGVGFRPEVLEGHAEVSLRRLMVAGLEAEVAELRVRAADGRLSVDELALSAPYFSLSGSGDLALREDAADGILEVRWESESLARMRPFLLGEDPIAADTLTPLEREVLRFDGIDPDTLGAAEQLVLDGAGHGELRLTGGVQHIDADGFFEVVDVVIGETSLVAGRTDFLGHWTRDGDWAVEGVVDLDQFTIEHIDFLRGGGEVSYRPNAGAFRVDVQRTETETYRTNGTLSHDSVGFEVGIDALSLDVDDVTWVLDEPARIRLEDSSYAVDRFRLVRPAREGELGMRVEVAGVLNLDGTSDLRVEVEGMDLERFGRLAQVQELPSGILDLVMSVEGPADDPRVAGHIEIEDFRFNGAALTRFGGTLDYADRRVNLNLSGELDGHPLLTVEGYVPLDLSFTPVEDRVPAMEADLRLVVDELPAATVLAFLEALEEVDGMLDGAVHVRGTLRDLEPSGELRLRDGAVFLSELGLRLTGVNAELEVDEQANVLVNVEAQSRGTARVTGTIALADPTNPGFDLQVSAAGFQAVDRRDITARVGGDVTLTGTFTAPRVGGVVRVEQGALYLEEIARTAEVVDLTDPAFFDVVDTTLVAVRPVVQAAQNPFVQNLRVDVDLTLQRDFWLRSRDMNAEMGGELIVIFDRPRREILLVGNLEAIRGTYMAFGRQFQVQDGSVEFVGTPGINPSLAIEAVARLRRQGGEPLNISAHVEGTLLSPQVRLSTDAQPPIGESDLISYLFFGRPSYALGSGETSVLQGAAGAGVSMGIGTVASQLGTVVAQQFGIDYFTITQAQEGGGLEAAAGLSSSFAGTQIEVGQYVGQNLFLALVLRPLTGLGARSQNQFPGARLEWRFTDAWSMEGFVEDRFAREGASGFGELGLRLSKVMGLSLYREWGY